MRKHLIAHVKSNLLGNPGIDVAFKHAYQIGSEIGQNRCHDKEYQHLKVSFAQTFIDNLTR